MSPQELKQRFVKLHEQYGLDRIEFAKIMIIVSTTLLIVSIHAVMSFQSAQKDVKSATDGLSKASAVMEDQQFKQNLEALKNIKGSTISNSLSVVVNSIEQSEGSIEKTKSAEKTIKNSMKTYQWMTLGSILGIVAGVALVYI